MSSPSPSSQPANDSTRRILGNMVSVDKDGNFINPYNKERTPAIVSTSSSTSNTDKEIEMPAPEYDKQKASSTNSGYNTGVIIYNKYAQEAGKKLFKDLQAPLRSDIAANIEFKSTVKGFADYMVTATQPSGQPYEPKVKRQYFSNFYNALTRTASFGAFAQPSWYSGICASILTRSNVNAHTASKTKEGKPKEEHITVVRREDVSKCVMTVMTNAESNNEASLWSAW